MEDRRSVFEYRDQEVPAGTKVLVGPEGLAAIAHPIRSRLMTHLGSATSVKELGVQLKLPPSRLYHHVKRLVDAGLVEQVAGRRVGSNTERLFRVTARRIEVTGQDLPSGSVGAAEGIFLGAGAIGDDLVRSTLADEIAVLASAVVDLDPEAAVKLARRLVRVVGEVAEADRKRRKGRGNTRAPGTRAHVVQIAVTRTERPVGSHGVASTIPDIEQPRAEDDQPASAFRTGRKKR